MPQYRFTGGEAGRAQHHEDGELLGIGDIVEMPAERYRTVADRFVPVTAASSAVTMSETDYSFLADQTSAQAIESIKALSTSDEVQAARDAEEAGKHRKSVLAAADVRLEELA